MDFYALVQQCNIQRPAPPTMAAIAETESGFNPYAIGVVKGYINQPKNKSEAILAVRKLKRIGKNFSVGLMQINKVNWRTYNMNEKNMFDVCTNLKAGADIFNKCYDRADRKYGKKYSHDGKLRLAMSCYYSGNFKTGFKRDFPKQPPYVTKVYTNLKKYRGHKYSKPRIQTNLNQYIPQNMPLPQSGEELARQATIMENQRRNSNYNPAYPNYQQNQQVMPYPVDYRNNQPIGIAKIIKQEGEKPKKSNKKGDLFATKSTVDLFS